MMILTMTYSTFLLQSLQAYLVELEARMVIDHGRRCSCILLDYHLKICDQVLYPPSRLRCAP
jgi:hypothetical protein